MFTFGDASWQPAISSSRRVIIDLFCCLVCIVKGKMNVSMQPFTIVHDHVGISGFFKFDSSVRSINNGVPEATLSVIDSSLNNFKDTA